MTEAREFALLCPRCGEENPAGFPVCWSCHADLPDEPVERAAEPAAEPAPARAAVASAARRERVALEVAVVLAVLWLPILLSGILNALEPFPPQNAVEALFGMLAGAGGLALIGYLAWLGGEGPKLFALGRPRGADALWAAGTFVVLVLAGDAVGRLAAFFPFDEHAYGPRLEPGATWLAPLYYLFWAAYEEVLFRAYLWSRLRALTGRPWLAIVATSVLFSAYHVYPLAGSVAVFVHGLVFGAAFLARRSLWPLVLSHWAFNLFVAGS
jgi:membrane protease YdiL (CAAX protease family)